ncbi:MAG: Crp/Fnr family transcriptional regulator [Kiloniellales bacterium]|nr:Crp/Fnr family transcriptional regulator [Kiloniellales bacterium]
MAEVARPRLEHIELLKGVDEEQLRRLESRCRWRRYGIGDKIFDRGDSGRQVFFVIEGRVNVVDFTLSGREVAFASAVAGDSFGELAAIDGLPRSTSVVAVETTYLGILPHEPFIALLRENAEIAFRVLVRLAEIVRRGDERIMELSTLAATHRVYAEILRMAQPDAAVPDLWVVRPLPPLREIASRVSTTRETVARALGQLYPSGLLRRKGRNLYLMDRTALQQKIYAWQLESSVK